MPQPTSYSRQYNFNDYQTSSPSDPLPADEVDGELNAVKTNLDGINTNIAKIQRDDGELANASVGAQQFDNGALALIGASGSGFTIKGVWAASTDYVIGDLVEDAQATYYCSEAHESGAAFADNSSKFILIANAAISSSAAQVEKFTGDGSTTTFTLTNSHGSDKDVMVFVGGSLKTPQSESSSTDTASYTVSGTTLTFVTAPPSSSTPNIFVWGPSVTSAQYSQAAGTSADTASGHAVDAGQHRTTASDWAKKDDGTVVDADTSVDSNEYSSKAYASVEGANAPSSGSSKEWATKDDGAVDTEFSSKAYASVTGANAPTEGSSKEWAVNAGSAEVKTSEGYSSKAYAQDETTGTDTTGGSSKGWSQTAKDTQVPGAGTADRSAKHYSEVASDHADTAEGYKDTAGTAAARFLGNNTTGPTTRDPNGTGDDLVAGDFYYNTGDEKLYIYNGSTWETMEASMLGNTITSTTGSDLSIATPSNNNNIVINSGSASFALPNSRGTGGHVLTSGGDGAVAWEEPTMPPEVTSVSPTTFNGESGEEFTINGVYFDSTSVVKFITLGGNEYTAGSTSRVSTTQLTATTPQDFTVADEPLDVKVLNGSGFFHVLEDAIDCGGVPSWSGLVTSHTIFETQRVGETIQFTATDPESQTMTYTVTNGSLPTGMSLSSSGLLSGTANEQTSDTAFTFKITATDASGNATQSGDITVTVKAPVETMYTYSGTTSWSGNLQSYSVPSGVTQVVAYIWGAGGGGGSGSSSWGAGGAGGGGGYAFGKINTTNISTLTIVVGGGGEGQDDSSSTAENGGYGGGGDVTSGENYGGAGGGLSGIFDSSASTFSQLTQSEALISAGGAGGGAASYWEGDEDGGAGGGTSGQNGEFDTNWSGSFNATGGTQSAGGVAYTSLMERIAEDGSALQGGRPGYYGGNYSSGGAGGGGYYGGAGGGYRNSIFGGGAGGSGFLHSTLVSDGVLTQGDAQTPGNSTHSYRTGSAADVGNGGDGAEGAADNGEPGYVVLVY